MQRTWAMFLDPRFSPLLGRDLDRLVATDSTVYGLFADLTIGFTNPAWDRFAAANGAPALPYPEPRRRVLDAITAELAPFYAALFTRVLLDRVPVDHTYACHSARLFRRFRMRVLPAGEGLVVIHHLVVEHAIAEATADPAVIERYRDADGMITQCCHCRTVRRPDAPRTWDWVPSFVERPPDELSHGLCPMCFRHYYPELAARYDDWAATQPTAG